MTTAMSTVLGEGGVQICAVPSYTYAFARVHTFIVFGSWYSPSVFDILEYPSDCEGNQHINAVGWYRDQLANADGIWLKIEAHLGRWLTKSTRTASALSELGAIGNEKKQVWH